jgi:hypothetical protein
VTVIDCVVAPVDQRFPVADDEVSVTEAPAQNELAPLMVGVVAAGLAVTATAAELAEQPVASVTVTVKEPAADTVTDCVVAPVDQRFPVADDEVSVTVLPGQNEAGPLMVGVAGRGFCVTRNGADVAAQPPASVKVTVYDPPAETAIDCVVAPVDQRLPLAEDDVSVTVPPAQKEEAPLIVGVTEPAVTVIGTSFDSTAPPHTGIVVQTRK